MIDRQKRKAYAWKMKGAWALTVVFIAIVYASCVRSSSLICGSPSSGPTNNPIAQHYSDDYAWTEQLQWSCVYNINDFTGKTDQERFNKAQNIAFKNGGGVVYLPTGDYRFTDDLKLKAGVVIRGDASEAPNAVSEHYAPQTKLSFPAYQPMFSDRGTSNEIAFKKIQSNKEDSSLGLVNLDINRAGIEFGTDVDTAQNQNILVYGVRSNNVATPILEVPSKFQLPWLRYPSVHTANIRIFGYANILVANNRLNDSPTDSFEQPNYQVQDSSGSLITYKDGGKIPFSYTNHYGISINRFKNNSVFFKPFANPKKEPGLFRKNIVIRDNWVYHTMRAGIHASGDGLVIQDNVIRDQSGKRWYTDNLGLGQPYLNDPDRLPPNISYENRAIDWSGWDVTIKGNNYEVYRHYLGDSQDQSVDGEGILIQECCGGTRVNGVEITENIGNSYIGLYKVPKIENVKIISNKLISNMTNTSLIYVNADTNKEPHSMNNLLIKSNEIDGDIYARASKEGQNNFIEDNYGTLGRANEIAASCHVQLKNNKGFSIRPCFIEEN